MRFAARLIATMTVAFVMVPGLYADDAVRPRAEAKNDESATSVAAPSVRTEALPTAAESSSSRPGPAGAPAQSAQAARNQGKSKPEYPKVELFLGYSFWRAMPTSLNNRIGYMHGGNASVAYNINRYLGLVADFSGFGNSRLTLFTPTTSRTVDSNGNAFLYTAGPRLSYRRYERFTPYVQALVGRAHAGAVTISGCAVLPDCSPLGFQNSFAALLGVGLDVKITHHIAARLFEADYLLTKSFRSGPGGADWQNNVRISSGIVFRFGGNPPPPPIANRPPVASCAADKSMVFVGSGDMVAITATASDPDDDPLTYTWSASGGRIDGSGPQVRWLSAGTAAGNYTVTLRVDDGRGGSANCNAAIAVEARPNRPPTIACAVDRSSVFAAERVHITTNANDPDGDPLTYAWRANAGQVVGTGAAVDFDTTGLAPGNYTVTARVDDGRGGAADCSTTVEVKAVPVPPQASKINECAFGKPLSERIDNVCKRILDDVALRLQNDPRATAVIIGYSDPKERRPDQVAGNRGTNAVKYLGEKGIDASRVKTRTGTGQAGATNNRRIDVVFVPEGATY